MKKPFFSIIIPVFNGSIFIEHALKSVFAQTFNDYEVIVIDDGSVDLTKSIVEKCFKENDCKNHLFITYTENRGVSYARNLGIKSAKGKFVAFLDADDKWYKNKMEKVYNVFTNKSDIDLVCHNENYVNDRGIIKQVIYDPKVDNIHDFLLFKSNCISTSAVTVRKTKLEQVGMFSEKLLMAEDYDLWIKLSKIAIFYFLNEILGEYRLQFKSLTVDLGKFTDCVLTVVEEHFNEYDNKGILAKLRFKRRKAAVFFETAIGAYLRGMWSDCIEYCFKCIRMYPLIIRAYFYITICYLKKISHHAYKNS
jgi:glycosyltransferase involved in cell wall biosynthesis